MKWVVVSSEHLAELTPKAKPAGLSAHFLERRLVILLDRLFRGCENANKPSLLRLRYNTLFGHLYILPNCNGLEQKDTRSFY